MILKALNGKKLVPFGYAEELEYTNPEFHGHQIGISLGVTDVLTGNIVETYISETQGDISTREAILESILNDESIVKVEKRVSMFENGMLVPRTIWFAPYAVKDHSTFQEGVNFSNLIYADNATNHVVLELLFVYDNLNRYITMSYDTKDWSVMDIVYNVFESANDIQEWVKDIKIVSNPGEYDGGYCLDFYDEAGEKVVVNFSDLRDLRNTIVSVRLLEVNTVIEDD